MKQNHNEILTDRGGEKALFRLKNYDIVHIKVKKKHQQTTFLTEIAYVPGNVLPIKLATQHQTQIYEDTQQKIADLIPEGAIAKTPVNNISITQEYQPQFL